MKCPNDNADLVLSKRDGVAMETCPVCNGMWLTRQELEQLEDKVFDFGDNEKGSLMLGSSPTALACPECAAPMKSFQYRLYDLEMDFCEAGHGYWLTADEDKRVLELMKVEEKIWAAPCWPRTASPPISNSCAPAPSWTGCMNGWRMRSTPEPNPNSSQTQIPERPIAAGCWRWKPACAWRSDGKKGANGGGGAPSASIATAAIARRSSRPQRTFLAAQSCLGP